jgi:dTDP-4-amino-4,6-dideoxygalactose transaminase
MIKLLQPFMPSAAELQPYLEQIDASSWYTNHGPLVQQVERELDQIITLPTHFVSNGTVALQLALHAAGVTFDDLVVVPAMTFRATGLAIRAVGAHPVLMDVDQHSWLMEPDAFLAGMRKNGDLDDAVAVVPVAAFGAPVDIAGWARVAEITGKTVVIDAAGALTEQPVVDHELIHFCYSMHATKFFGCGEGGAVASANETLMEKVRSLSAFGPGGINAKASEYHAAVMLASLCKIHEKRLSAIGNFDLYYSHMPSSIQKQAADIVDRVVLPVMLPAPIKAHMVMNELAGKGIQSAQWYRPFLDEPYVLDVRPRRDPLPHTEEIRRRMIGLPFHHALTHTDIRWICKCLQEIVGD